VVRLENDVIMERTMKGCTTAGQFEGDGAVPFRGSAERRRGSLTLPWNCPVSVEDVEKRLVRRDTCRPERKMEHQDSPGE
jgi:hypothetical protein